MDQRFQFDALSALLLLATALIGAYCPRYLAFKGGLQVGDGRNLAFHLGNMLSAGVMLSAGFCHLLADSLRQWDFPGRFPVQTFLAAAGYIVTLVADQAVQHATEEPEGHGAQLPPGSSPRMSHGKPSGATLQESPRAKPSIKAGSDAFLTSAEVHTRSAAAAEHGAGGLSEGGGGSSEDGVDGVCAPLRGGGPRALESGLAGRMSEGGGLGHDHQHAHIKVFLAHKSMSFATTVLLAGALCVHSILEGMALGSQTTMKDTEDIMIAIAAHKGLAAYALGASIVESKASAEKFWTVVGIFAAATPLGIFVGYGFSELGSGAAGAAMSALASGTFLYVAMMEVIPKELEDSHNRVLKMAMLLLGFGLMSLLAVWA